MSEITWSEAPQSVLSTAQDLINQYHPWLTTARIAFVMRSESQKHGERYIVGQATKIADKMKPHFEFDFLIWLSEQDYTSMDSARREALIDHELCHCGYSLKSGTWTIREHDIQEFGVIIQRHGLWTSELMQMGEIIDQYKQGHLFSDTQIEVSAGGRVATITGEQLEKLSKMSPDELGKLAKAGAEAGE